MYPSPLLSDAVEVLGKDLSFLDDEAFLNDTIIDFYMKKLLPLLRIAKSWKTNFVTPEVIRFKIGPQNWNWCFCNIKISDLKT